MIRKLSLGNYMWCTSCLHSFTTSTTISDHKVLVVIIVRAGRFRVYQGGVVFRVSFILCFSFRDDIGRYLFIILVIGVIIGH